MTAKNTFGAQAAKTLCANLYAAWLSEEENVEQIRGLLHRMMALSAAAATTQTTSTSSKNAATSSTATTENSILTAAEGAAAASGDRNGKYGGVEGRGSNGVWHSDPVVGLSVSPGATAGAAAAIGGEGGLDRGKSPQPVSPHRWGNTTATWANDERTPSPSHPSTSPSAATWRLPGGVDELDYPHRGGSPAAAPLSPLPKPVVDPNAPLPHASPGSVASHNAHTPGGARLDPILTTNAVFSDFAVPVDANPSLGATVREGSARFVQNSGTFAASPPANLKQASLQEIPRFYSKKESRGLLATMEAKEVEELNHLLDKNEALTRSVWIFGDISSKVFKVPIWYKEALFKDIATRSGLDPAVADTLTATQIRTVYNEVYAPLTESRRLYELICTHPKKEYITLADLEAMGDFLVAAHPGLGFLQEPVFQEYYQHTVAVRIMYTLERQQCGRIYWRDFDRSDLPEKMAELDVKDVNAVLEYFSYEHFYVLYCKFWELDTDRDFLIDYEDLCHYGQGSVVTGAIRRVVEGCGRPLSSGIPGKMDFQDFVCFCLSEEDKNSEPAVLYWFKVLDTDEDGILSGYEMMQFFEENRKRFLEYSDSPEGDISYEDTMCQMLDMIGFDRVKTRQYGVTLGDLRSCATPANFFNMLLNASKFLLFEYREPFSEHQMRLCAEKTEWDRFARAEYDRVVAEAQ